MQKLFGFDIEPVIPTQDFNAAGTHGDHLAIWVEIWAKYQIILNLHRPCLQINRPLDIHALNFWFFKIKANYNPNFDLETLDMDPVSPFPSSPGFHYFYSRPFRQKNFMNLVSIFSPTLWSMVLASTIMSFLVLALRRTIYKNLEGEHLVKEIDTISVLFKVISTLTEPNTVNIFPKWCTGSCFQLYTITNITSNLP